MQWRAFGVLLLVISLVMVILAVSNIKTYPRIEVFAKNAEDGEDVNGVTVNVPPWNASEETPPRGWVGFDVNLEHAGKKDYEAYGFIQPNDGDQQPAVVMRVVNQTGLNVLKFEGFDSYIFDTIKIYAGAILNSSRLIDNFRFIYVDNSPNYTFLFRCLKNDTQDRPIMLSLVEAWLEERNLMEPFTSNAVTITGTATAIVGLALTIRNPRPRRKVHRPKTQTHIKFPTSKIANNTVPLHRCYRR